MLLLVSDTVFPSDVMMEFVAETDDENELIDGKCSRLEQIVTQMLFFIIMMSVSGSHMFSICSWSPY